jgi:hypothetical protein
MSHEFPKSIMPSTLPDPSDYSSAHDYINDGKLSCPYLLSKLVSDSKFTVVPNSFTQTYAKTVFDTMTCLYASTKYSSTPLGYRYNGKNYKNMFIDVDIQNYNKKMFENNTINLKNAKYINSKNGDYILLNKCPGTDTINEISIHNIVSGDKAHNEFQPNQIQNIINDYDYMNKKYLYKCFTIMNAYSPVTYFTHENQYKSLSGSRDNIRDFFFDFYGDSIHKYRFTLINYFRKPSELIMNLNEHYDYWLVSKYFDEESDPRAKYWLFSELIEVIPNKDEGTIKYKRFKVYDPTIYRTPIQIEQFKKKIPQLLFEDFCIGNLYKIIGIEKNHINMFIKEMTTLLGLNRNALEFFHIHVGYNCDEKLIILTIHGKYEITHELNHTNIDNIDPNESIPKYYSKLLKPIKYNNFLNTTCQNSILMQSPTDITLTQWNDHNTYIIINESGNVTVLKHTIQKAIPSNLLCITNFSLNILANQDEDILYAPEVIPNPIYDPFPGGGRKKKRSIIKSKYNKKKSRKIYK